MSDEKTFAERMADRVLLPRRLICSTEGCPQFGQQTLLFPRRHGPFIEWPLLLCVCGAEPRICEVRPAPSPRQPS